MLCKVERFVTRAGSASAGHDFAPRIYTRSGLTRIVIETTEDFAPELKQKGRELSLNFQGPALRRKKRVSLTDSIVNL